MNMAQRLAATERVVARFRHHGFSWRERRTCIHLARAQMRAMGHRPPVIPDFRSALGARKALQKTGHADLAALLDTMLPRIAPLEMMLGDLALVPGEDGLDALGVSAGSALLMYHADADGLVPVKGALLDIKAAWRL